MSLKEDVKNARERWQHAAHEVRESRKELKQINKQLDEVEKDLKDAKPGGDRKEKLRRREDRLEAKKKQLQREKDGFAEMKKRRDNVKDDLVKKLKKRQKEDKPSGGGAPSGNWTAPGYNTWGGCRAVCDNEVLPVLNKHGIPVTSRKRTETYGNPTSDHHVSQTMADAIDGGAANAYGVGDEIGGELGVGNVDDYVNEYFTYNGVRFRVQIIAATHGTGPHIHTGIRRA